MEHTDKHTIRHRLKHLASGISPFHKNNSRQEGIHYKCLTWEWIILCKSCPFDFNNKHKEPSKEMLHSDHNFSLAGPTQESCEINASESYGETDNFPGFLECAHQLGDQNKV